MTKNSPKAYKTRLLCATGALFIGLLCQPAHAGFAQNADTSQLISRINQLENQVQTLSRAVYRGNGAPPPADANPIVTGGDMSASAVSGYEERISQLETQQRQVTNQLEQISYEMQQLKERVNTEANNNAHNASFSVAAPPANDSSYNRPPPGETDYSGNAVSSSSAPQPRGKLLGTMSSGGSTADTPNALYDDAFNDIRDAKYDSAAVKFQQFMDKYSTHPLAANAQYWLAETYYVKQDYHQAAKLFAQDYQDYPQGSKASASLLKLGLSLSKLGKKDDACLSLKQLKKEFPGDETPEIRRADQEIKTLGCAG